MALVSGPSGIVCGSRPVCRLGRLWRGARSFKEGLFAKDENSRLAGVETCLCAIPLERADVWRCQNQVYGGNNFTKALASLHVPELDGTSYKKSVRKP